ncbi:MAG: glycosyltransferase family 4 protein, partial [Cyanobacteria bacterium P01_F01_bin.42]
FIGSDHPFSSLQPSCKAYLQSILADDLDAVEFTGKVSLHEIPQYLEQTDICVFPSLWENFPNVCLEAMAAGRGVVGSSAGGMAEMLDNGRVGMLVPPDNSDAIANAIMALLSSPEQRMEFGRKARARIISEYSLEGLGQHLERSYQRAIRRRQQIGPRYSSTQKVYVRT